MARNKAKAEIARLKRRVAGAISAPGGGGGVTDHGLLTGLGDDDHLLYHTDARGDARYSQLGHSHTSSQITDFGEAVDDRVALLLVEGAGIDLTYDDGSNTLTVAAVGGGSGTVTSVAVANATGITWTGSPITTSGTFTPTLSANLQAWSGLATSSKLDTSVYTAADVLAKLLTVDGSGSGVDADLLDGNSSAFFRDASNLNAGTLPAGQFPALTGDVTTSAGALGTTIANDAVTLAKMADVATGTVFYRKTASTGDPEVQTLATLKTDLGLTGTNSGDQTITLTGDVTGSGTGSFATDIAAGVIVNADINASAAIALSKLATDPLARANHTGTQTASTISDFSEAVDDRVGALLVEGSGIDLTYDDGANTLTIACTVGGVSDGDKGDIVVGSSGTDWQIDAGAIVNADINASANIALSKLATDPLARANHTGTQTSSTISDFNTAVDARIPVSVVSLSSDATSNSTTTGVEITGLQKSLVAGTYTYTYYIRYFSGATTTGVKFGVNYTGTTTTIINSMRAVGTGTTATTGTLTQNSSSGTIVEGYAARTASTTAPNLGPSLASDASGSSMLIIIEGILICTGSGDLELWHASEVAATSTVKAGSALVIHKVG